MSTIAPPRPYLPTVASPTYAPPTYAPPTYAPPTYAPPTYAPPDYPPPVILPPPSPPPVFRPPVFLPPPVPPKKGHTLRDLLIAFVALITLIAVVTTVSRSGSKSAAPSANPSVGTSAAVTTPAPTTASVVPPVVPSTVAPTPSAPSLKTQVVAWSFKVAAPMAQMQTDLTSASTAATNYDLAGLTSACIDIRTDVVSVRAQGNAPDATLSSDYTQFLNHLDAAMTAYLGDGDLVTMSSEMTLSTYWLNLANVRFEAITA